MTYIANIITLMALWCLYRTITLYRQNDADCFMWAFLGLVFAIIGAPLWIFLTFN